jgi:hypothetical protein
MKYSGCSACTLQLAQLHIPHGMPAGPQLQCMNNPDLHMPAHAQQHGAMAAKQQERRFTYKNAWPIISLHCTIGFRWCSRATDSRQRCTATCGATLAHAHRSCSCTYSAAALAVDAAHASGTSTPQNNIHFYRSISLGLTTARKPKYCF